jgi:peptidoglycan/LPS O-acetylase OafA/YrhL
MGLVRLALALAVLLSHLPSATVHFIGGGVAVQGFFIVSGFYMALVLRSKYTRAGLFYSNRLLRLFPAYFVMVAVAAVSVFALRASATATPELFATAYQNPATALLLAFQNVTTLGQEALYWFKLDSNGNLFFDAHGQAETDQVPVAWRALLVPQAWSLSMELVFYAVAPFLARLKWTTLAWLAVASIALRFAGHLLNVDDGLWQGRFFPTALFLFLFGMLAQRALPIVTRLPKALGWIVTALLLTLIAAEPQLGLDDESGRWVIYSAIALATPFVFNAFKDFSFDRWIGDLSYPIYLTHLVIVGLVLTFQPALPGWVSTGATLAATLAASIVLLVLIDQPIDRWRQARAKANLGRSAAVSRPAAA